MEKPICSTQVGFSIALFQAALQEFIEVLVQFLL